MPHALYRGSSVMILVMYVGMPAEAAIAATSAAPDNAVEYEA